MKIRDRYIAKTLLMYSTVVMLVWLSIYSFFNFLSELNSVGTSNYTIFESIKFIVLRIPEVAYDQASAVILLGCLLGMGHLVTTSQLLIFRVSGLSILRTSWITVKNALFLIFILILIGEVLAPALTKYAESERATALGQVSLSNNQDGFWIRDGDNFVNVENNVDGILFSGITIFEVNKSNKIESIINSESATFDGKSLNLNETDIFSISSNNKFENIGLTERNSYNKIVAFDQDLIASLEKEPKDLSTYSIIKQIQFLTDNKLRAGVFEVELYSRLVKPISLIAMILLAMLFIFGSNRDATLGRKIFFGVAIGLSFELVSRIAGAMALSFDFSPLISSFALPLLVIIIVTSVLINKSTN
jgi:lipopolysaccharide export system permease protein